jgi:hypothetical protein
MAQRIDHGVLKLSLQAEMTLYLGYNSGDQFDGAVVIFRGARRPAISGAYPTSLQLAARNR